ncbi:MAG: PAS-domain containing protein [Roseinatronobacter sp.]|nr:PAS-domain containing protein [Roseinatronobacter sp.]
MAQAVLFGFMTVFSAAAIVLASLAILNGLQRNKAQAKSSLAAVQMAAFIFRGETLVDCSERGAALLASLPSKHGRDALPLTRLIDYLVPRFPLIEQQLAALPHNRDLTLLAEAAAHLELSLSYRNGLTHIRLCDLSEEGALLAVDRLSYDALQKELLRLRCVLRDMPSLVWQQDDAGRIIWANAAYVQALQARHTAHAPLSWPLPDLFAPAQASTPTRRALEMDGKTYWFSHSTVPAEGGVTHFATPIDAAVHSETARRETLQQLTKTFASLPIGLALFDAERRLVVFNPALVDMTGLEPLFLAARPSFEQLLYALREARMLPEPKDFNSWRRAILDMEKAAQNGDYTEEWALECGKTYLVTGRPQPDGAFALFLQDITSEAMLTRSFRAEIDTAHNALDKLSQAVVVFGLNGQTLLANAPYIRLWHSDPCADLSDRGLATALEHWANACEPTAFWARLAEFVTLRLREGEGAGKAAMQDLTGLVRLQSGGRLRLHASRLAGGSTMLCFTPEGAAPRRASTEAAALLRADVTLPRAPARPSPRPPAQRRDDSAHA